ncbi:MAG: hypothetical protein HRT81_01630 [Henriciella sp.]|nr:hypothetical protein [Henriciella sp.]
MLRAVIDMLRQLMPADGELKFLNRFQYRALKPTWPVAFSILFLALAFLIPDQGRAIIKFTIDRASNEFDTSVLDNLNLIFLFVIHGAVMMYTAFMLSAVTRRSQMDAQTEIYESAQRDPVDPSVTLRLRYAYWCGVLLPLLFMGMGFWFQYGLHDLRFWGVVVFGIVIGLLYTQCARMVHQRIADKRSEFNQLSTKPSLLQNLAYTLFSFIHFCIAPEHRNSQAAIAALSIALGVLTVGSILVPDFEFPGGPIMFFVCFISLHLIYRYFKDRIVRLHQGHTARYIIIDPTVEFVFKCVRIIGVIFIPIVFWIPSFVDFLGPLGVGLFGTLWGTLFFSGLVESSARHVRADEAMLTDEEKGTSWLKRRWNEFQSMRQSYSMKSWFFLFLVALLFVELLVSSLEVLAFEPRPTWDMLIFLLLLGVFLFRRRIWESRVEFRSAVNRLPSASVLAPILLLGLGEAHHIHRVDKEADGSAFEAYTIDDHATKWIEARMAPARENKKPITAIVVLAEGGGIRAGAHAGYYLSRLDTALIDHCTGKQRDARDQPIKPDPVLCSLGSDTRLLDHVYSINGVSGGAVGSAVYLAAVKEELGQGITPEIRHKVIDQTLQSDFLSPLFAGLFGSDALTTVFPAQLFDRVVGLADDDTTDAFGEYFERGIYDRADFFENRLANVFDRAMIDAMADDSSRVEPAAGPKCRMPVSDRGRRTMDQTLESVARCAIRVDGNVDSTDPGPMVFFSTFYETGGYQMATSNVDVSSEQSGGVSENCGSVPIVQQLIDWVEPDEAMTGCARRTKTLPLSTAAHLSARFPVSNPTGVVETRNKNGRWNRHHFVDGGYMDNSGSLTAIQSVEALREAARGKAPINVIVLNLYALGIPDQGAFENETGQRATKQSEFTSIPSAVLKARGAASRAPIRLLCNSLLDYSSGDRGALECDKIFERRVVTAANADTFTNKSYCKSKVRPEYTKGPRYPVDPDRSGLIELNAADDADPWQSVANGENPFRAASWIPVPLEVARSDRQENAITALLGWSLLKTTTDNMNAVMEGTAEITLVSMADSIIGSDHGMHREWTDPVELQECNDVR